MDGDDTVTLRLDRAIGAGVLGRYILDLLERNLPVLIEPPQFLVEHRENRDVKEEQDEGLLR